jgi:hypothetical protein
VTEVYSATAAKDDKHKGVLILYTDIAYMKDVKLTGKINIHKHISAA